ncbi:MAG: carboxypeptidase-like regulatory domain-containing protein, partial [bacterium]
MRFSTNRWTFLSISLLFPGILPVFSQPPAAGSPPAILTGTITNAVTSAPVTGAKITVNNQVTWSVTAGFYSLPINPVGTFPVTCRKPGFDLFTSAPVTFLQGQLVTMNISLWENLNPPGLVNSILDTALQTVHLSWDPPRGNYELLYDDGIQDNFTVWATQGNMNAVKFTPVAWPVMVTGGSVHIGTNSNYPAGSNPLVPFQVAVYNASGHAGMPGSLIGGPFDVLPAGFGWNTFTFSSSVTIPSGNFYLVMIQGGNAPNAAGLAVDMSSYQMRSVARFVTGGGRWVPAGGNFMLRAVVNGPGGPVNSETLSESLLNYKVYRLRQGEEQNPIVWTDLGNNTLLFFDDNSWFYLPCGPWRWGVKACYSGDRSSPVAFSNILGKCWTVNVTVDITLSCEDASQAGTYVCLKNLVYPDTLYTYTLDTGSVAFFTGVWKGSYELKVTKFGYQNSVNNVSFTCDTTLPVFLLQEKPPPTNLQVHDKTLLAQWNVPTYSQLLFSEDWTSSSFATQGWTVQGGYNWLLSSVVGNPAPSAMFSWSPQVLNYSQTLTSKEISGVHSPVLTCTYDIYLDNFGTTTLNQMAVEIWDGTSWQLLKNYTNALGNIPWTTDQVNLPAYTDIPFRLRFRAYGEDSYDINGWNVDNIRVDASETNAGLLNCILGYNFYLGNVLSGFTAENKYLIPGNQVQYGQTYNACVLAVYGSGYSAKTCTPFTSHFLYPPTDLIGTPIENNIYLEWAKPKTEDLLVPPGLLGYRIYRNNSLLDIVEYPDTLFYYDFGLDPGTYQYEVSAWYDLASYGFPGQFDESMKTGPVPVTLNYGQPLPFFEPWDQASFTYNDWRFYPGQGNWQIDGSEGNPAPSAQFGWDPLLVNYSYSLESPVLDASLYECTRIWLDFDLRLADRFGTGMEKLSIEVWYNNLWHKMTEYSNGGSFNWMPRHIDISPVAEQAFRIRFRATGMNSADIFHWYIDNIYIYPICYPAENLQGEALGNSALLTWSPPQCSGAGGQLNEGFEGALFPPPGWDLLIANPTATWSHMTATSQLGVHSGNFSAGILWDYYHQDEWLI